MYAPALRAAGIRRCPCKSTHPMLLWLAFALMTAAAIFAVLWPLSRRGEAGGGSEVAVYRDQLDEVVRDRSVGLIGEQEADAARIEVSRRLIAASAAPGAH